MSLTESNYEHNKRLSHGRSPRPSVAESRIDFKTRGSGVRGRKRIAFTKATKNEIPKTRIVKNTKKKMSKKRFNSKSMRSISRSPHKQSRSKSSKKNRGSGLPRKMSKDALPKTVTINNPSRKSRSRSRSPIPLSNSFISTRKLNTPSKTRERVMFNYSNQKSGTPNKGFVNNNDSPSKRYKNRGYPSPVSGAQQRDFSNFRKHEMDQGYIEAPINSFHQVHRDNNSSYNNKDNTPNRMKIPQQEVSKNPYFILKDRNRSKDINRDSTPNQIGVNQLKKNNNGYNVYGINPNQIKSKNQVDRRSSRTPQKIGMNLHSGREMVRNENMRERREREFDSRNFGHRGDRSRSRRHIPDRRSASRSPYGHDGHRRQSRSPRPWGWEGGNGPRFGGFRR